MTFTAGTQVTSVVRLVRPLGHGGMGAVWVAEHQTLRTDVVVKFMSEALASDPVSLARFSREAAAAAAVKSPHVVQMLDHGFMQSGTPFIIMELLEGEDLRSRLQRDHTVPLAELAVIVAQACKALGCAHAGDIIHRDIKPDNIFLCHTDDGEPFVKLLDFGVAKSGDPTDFHMTQTGVLVGTPFYMSPEQAVGAPPVDASTDLWSLGVVAYEAMTGVRPFDGLTLGALTIEICKLEPPVPSHINPTVPPAVDAWLARACARDRRHRFPSAKAMGDAFALALRASLAPGSVAPLAFEATAISDSRPAPRVSVSPAPLPATPAGASLSPSKGPPPLPPSVADAPHALVTTNSPLSVSQISAAPSRLAPVRKPLTTPAASGRKPYLFVGGALVTLGILAGGALAERDEGPALGSPVAPLAVPYVAPPARSPEAHDPHAPGTTPPRIDPLPAADTLRVEGAGSTMPTVDVTPGSATRPVRATPSVSPSTHPGASPAPKASATTAPSPAPSPPTAAPVAPVAPNCDPPFYFDGAHNKVFKKDCI